MSSPEPDRDAIAFAEQLLTLLGEGRYTATYKYAVLLALMDLCLEYSTRTGGAPSSLSTRQLAEKVLVLYWSHTLPFVSGERQVLQQNNNGQAKIVNLIRGFRDRHAPDPSANLARARVASPAEFERLVRDIEWKLVEMPLPRLQVIGNQDHRFIYTISWNQGISRGEFNNPDVFDNLIRFVGQSSDHLIRLSGLLRPLIKREWTALVARFNQLPEATLEQFLFGLDRASLTAIREPLRELADSRCFYCGDRVRSRFEIDHFIPWSRYPDNGIENLVLSDPSCNHSKLDHLAAARHFEHWSVQIENNAADLASIAERTHWDRHPERTVGVARSIYSRLPAEAMLWESGGEFVALDRPALNRAFGGLRLYAGAAD